MRLSLEENDCSVSKGFLQSRFWADFKSQAGWTYDRYQATVEVADGDGTAPASFALSVLERSLGAGLRFAYVPHGPETSVPSDSRSELITAIAEELRFRVSSSCVFVRFDPAWYVAESGSGISRPTFERPLVKASDVQPPDSVVLDIEHTDDELLAAMKPKWRYNIKLAEKKGVTAAAEGIESLGDFYELYRATAARDHIAIHPSSYYERLFRLEPANAAEPRPDLRLWVARYEGKALAGIITAYYGSEATYLYGASSDEHRNLMPAYALQWSAIRAAREAGCSTYDFYGIPPADDPSHAMSGLYRFKTGFGGEIRHYAGAWDYVLKPAVYAGFRAAERARLFWHKTVRKKLGH